MGNIYLRGKVYYIGAIVDGKRIAHSLGTGDKALATARAKKIIAEAKAGRWEVVDSIGRKKAPGASVSIGKALEVYRAVAHKLYLAEAKPRPQTVVGNCKALLRIVREVWGLDDDEQAQCQAVGIIGPALWQAYADQRLQEALDADEDMETARLSTGSTINQARSIFAGKFLDGFKEAGIELDRGRNPIKLRFPEYELPPQALIDATMTAGRALRGTNPGLYLAFVLCRDLGMRAGEAAAARWTWIEERAEEGRVRRWMDIRTRPAEGFEPKGRAHKVAIAATVHAHLVEGRREDDDYILPGGTPTERYNLVGRELANWMRGLGWTETAKAAHELRKLAGSEWYTVHSPAVACEWLGHKSVQTTCKFYAKLTRHPDPVEI